MPSARGGYHGNFAYAFEDNGYNQSPSDTTFKGAGGRARLGTFDAARQAERVYNADRKAVEIIRQNFDGGWQITTEGFTEPPWYLASVFGQPTASQVSGELYDYTYSLANGNEPVPLRFYLPTDGFNDYEVIPGAVAAEMSIDQSNDASPELTINGFYAEEPDRDNSLDPNVPDFSETSYSNRDAELLVDGDSVGIVQNTTLDLSTGARAVYGFSENVEDFVPGLWQPDMTWSKVIATDQTVDPLQRFKDGTQAGLSLQYDNGLTGEDEYAISFDVIEAYPDSWSESGRNNPEENLLEELQELAEDMTATVTTAAGDSGSPPGITL